ncbi:unnamed protein product [Pleuronectes platessa]|uniref:Uncharacterized protein n=1 Tax=Pleuronectes platessa TaxID=8262 RepID=A0A9N7ZAZ7_PLEPL|nr:unnamed protein product [Pleuronectes platessa]
MTQHLVYANNPSETAAHSAVAAGTSADIRVTQIPGSPQLSPAWPYKGNRGLPPPSSEEGEHEATSSNKPQIRDMKSGECRHNRIILKMIKMIKMITKRRVRAELRMFPVYSPREAATLETDLRSAAAAEEVFTETREETRDTRRRKKGSNPRL